MKQSNSVKANEKFFDLLLKLTRVEYDNLCKYSSKTHSKILYKTFKRTNSLKKIKRLSKIYETFVPHETYRPTLIPFVFKKVLTNPTVDTYKHATEYLEEYNMLLNYINNKLSVSEVKS